MKKSITLEIWVDESLEDAKECVNEVYSEMCNHYYLSDGSIEVKVIKREDYITTPQPLQIPNQSIIFTYDNIMLHAEIEYYIGTLVQAYDQLKDLTIVKDNEIFYSVHNICFPINPPKECNLINFTYFQKYICEYIVTQEAKGISDYWIKLALDKLLKDKNTLPFRKIIANTRIANKINKEEI